MAEYWTKHNVISTESYLRHVPMNIQHDDVNAR